MSLRPQRLALAAGLAAAALALASCSTDSRVVAQVGDRPITVSEFDAVATSVAARYPLPAPAAKAALLDDLVRRELLLHAAHTSGIVIDSLLQKYRRAVEEDVLLTELVGRIAVRDVPVSEAEARAFHAWRATETHALLIFVADRGAADAARHELDAGVPFADVAQRFNLPGALPPEGDAGFLAGGTLPDPLDHEAREAKVGSTIGPVQVGGQGWFIMRILARRPRRLEPFEPEAAGLTDQLRQRKTRASLVRAFDNLRAQYHVTTDPSGLEVLYRHFNDTSPLISGMGGQSLPQEPTPTELAEVVGRWDGGPGERGAYTVREALDDLEHGEGQRPNATMLPAFEFWAQGQLQRRVAAIEARRRHLNEEPPVARQIENKVNSFILDAVYRSEVSDRAVVTPADVAAVLARHPELGRLRSVTLEIATAADSASAMELAARARALPSLAAAAGAGIEVHQETVHYPTTDPVWGSLESTFQGAPPGVTLGPIRSGSRWRIARLVARDQGEPALDALPPGLAQSVQQEADEAARERRLTQLTDSLRTAVKVTVDRALLQRLRWPSAPLPMRGAG